MDQRTLHALKGSIQKWEKIAEGVGEDHGILNCPLCQLFFRKNCKGCPVFAFIGREGCRFTPYEEFGELMISSLSDCGSDSEKRALAIEFALEEAAFLRSLLPKEET